jgi:hypothetical protein
MPGCLSVVMGWAVLSELNQHLGKAATLLLCSPSKNNVRRGELAHELPPFARFCWAFDEWRTYFRSRYIMDEPVSLPEQRQAFLRRLAALKALIEATS